MKCRTIKSQDHVYGVWQYRILSVRKTWGVNNWKIRYVFCIIYIYVCVCVCACACACAYIYIYIYIYCRLMCSILPPEFIEAIISRLLSTNLYIVYKFGLVPPSKEISVQLTSAQSRAMRQISWKSRGLFHWVNYVADALYVLYTAIAV